VYCEIIFCGSKWDLFPVRTAKSSFYRGVKYFENVYEIFSSTLPLAYYQVERDFEITKMNANKNNAVFAGIILSR